jgi:hypothetical protein
MMAKPFKLTDYFLMRNVTPSSLQQDNLITFSYKSPNGVHDNAPLVLVVEKRLDRIFGFNLHYDMREMDEVLINTYNKVNTILEREYYRKYPEKRNELRKKRVKFDKTMLTPEDLKTFSRRVNRNDLEQYLVKQKDMTAFRCYLFKRMNRVSKLTWSIKIEPQ